MILDRPGTTIRSVDGNEEELLPMKSSLLISASSFLLMACVPQATSVPTTTQPIAPQPVDVPETPTGDGTAESIRVVETVGPRARSGDIAVQEEYAAASADGSKAALELFIARHPDHPLAQRARSLLQSK